VIITYSSNEHEGQSSSLIIYSSKIAHSQKWIFCDVYGALFCLRCSQSVISNCSVNLLWLATTNTKNAYSWLITRIGIRGFMEVNCVFLVTAGVYLYYGMPRVITFHRCEYGNVFGFWNAPFSTNSLISVEYSVFAENIYQV
jgi:hypothetical protein